MLYSEQPTVLLARRHLNTVILTIFENLNSISNIFQETHNFLVLTDPSVICIYLRTTEKHFCDQVKVRYPTSKLPKWDLLQTLDTFRNPSFRILEGISCSIWTIIMFFSLNFIRIWISLHSLTNLHWTIFVFILVTKFLFVCKYFYSNSNNWNSNIIMLVSNYLFELKHFFVVWPFSILIKIFYSFASVRLWSAKGECCHPGFMGNCSTF